MIQDAGMVAENALYERSKTYYNTGLPYHNWDHIRYVTMAFTSLFGFVSATSRIAILYHGAIYVPGSPPGYNEDMSAAAFLHETRKLQVVPDYASDVVDIIRDTKAANHIASKFVPSSLCSAMVMDADLASLAAPFGKFLTNQHNILEEQVGFAVSRSDVTELENMHRKQCEFLAFFLEREHIYHTEEARKIYEKSARENIRKFMCQKVVHVTRN